MIPQWVFTDNTVSICSLRLLIYFERDLNCDTTHFGASTTRLTSDWITQLCGVYFLDHQLKIGGILIGPEILEDSSQVLSSYYQTDKNKFEKKKIEDVKFVPML